MHSKVFIPDEIYHFFFIHSQMVRRDEITNEGTEGSEGYVYRSLGINYFNQSNFKKALGYHQLDLKIAEDANDKAGQGLAYAYIGRAFFSLSDMKMAIVNQEKRLSIAEEIGDRVGQGRAFAHLGHAYYSLGDFRNALEYYQKRLDIAKEVEDRTVQGGAYANVGIAYHSLGEFKKAIEYHQLDLSIAEEIGDISGRRRAYANLGVAYHSLGDFKTALKYHQQDLSIAKEVGDKAGKGRAYGNIGIAHRSLGDFKTALKYHKDEVKIARDFGDKAVLGGANANLGNAYRALKDFEKAKECYLCHRDIVEDIGDKAGQGGAYANLGLVYRDLGKFQEALKYHQLELRICKEVGDKVGQGRAFANLGRVCHFLEDFDKALEYHQLDLEISKEFKAMADQARAYCNLGRVYHSLGELPKAENCFQLSVTFCEKTRDDLEDDWKISLRDHYKDAYNALWMVQLQQNKVSEALYTADRGRGQALIELMESRYDLKLAHSGASEEMEASSDVTSITSSQTIFLAGGRKEINIWVLEKESKFHFVRKIIDVENLQPLVYEVYEKIDAVSTKPDETGPTSSDCNRDALKMLYNMVINPVADLICGSEVIIVPDGLLFLIPFVALKDKHSKYLSESFRIRLAPSLASLKMLAKCPEWYHCSTGALLVGDPWVENIRISGEKVKELPYAREEVEMIGEFLKTDPLTGKEATKGEVLSRLSSVSLVHIAAHGYPETGEIVLSANRTRVSKKPRECDFLLTMKDVLNTKLRARLVVLSCCRSGRGKINSEGVVGIARAFLGAGARSVLVSLWAIDDKGTLQFMKHFYQHLLEGQSASMSLNQAMKCMRESNNFSDVRYWAPFVLIGDDVTLHFSQSRLR